jgi:ABC-type polysaccharide/polyol phosphate transport system ATPase subunit
MRISWSSGFKPLGLRPPGGLATGPLIEARDVSLKFLTFHDKSYSLKRAAVDALLRRENPQRVSEFWALREINLRIESQERVGIIGHNGAGKSTLLRLLARIYPPTEGALRIRGLVAPLIELGAGFHPELSGRENILLNGAMLGFDRRQMRERTDPILDFAGLREFADMPLKYYSSGMYVRLAFAIATEVEPDILLIDEALGVGDATFVAKAKARLRDLFGRSHAVVVVSHDLGALRDLCNRGLWMSHGRIVADGPIDEVVDLYEESIATQATG